MRTMLLGVLLTSLALPVTAQERATQPSTKQLIEQLGDREFEARQEAEKQLQELGKAAKAQLEKAAKDHEDPEVRWRARRILHGLDRDTTKRRERGGLRQREPDDRRDDRRRDRRDDRPLRGFDRIEDVDRLFEEIVERLERDLDIDIKDLRRQRQRAGVRARAQVRGWDTQSDGHGRSMKMSVTPDGVRVEVETQDKDGKADKKVYEAEDMESFKAKYPEVAKRFGIGGFSLGGPDVRMFRNLPDRDFGGRDFGRRIREQMQEHQRRQRELMEQLRGWKPHGQDLRVFGDPRVGRLFSWRDEAPAVSLPGERLGVYAVDAPAAVSEFLGLEAGQGLQVEEVIDGSLADTLGIQKGDIVFRIGDRKIFAVEDVRKALRSIQAGDTVVVQVNRRGKVLGLGAKKPASPQPEKIQPKKTQPKKTQPKKTQPKKLKQRGKVR